MYHKLFTLFSLWYKNSSVKFKSYKNLQWSNILKSRLPHYFHEKKLLFTVLSPPPEGKEETERGTDYPSHLGTQTKCKWKTWSKGIQVASSTKIIRHPFFFSDLFFSDCAGSSMLRVGFLQLQWAVVTLSCSTLASHCSGLSCCTAQALGTWVSVVAACSSTARAQYLWPHGLCCHVACGILTRPGTNLVSLALQGGFLTTREAQDYNSYMYHIWMYPKLSHVHDLTTETWTGHLTCNETEWRQCLAQCHQSGKLKRI